jgi:hypothetical protein
MLRIQSAGEKILFELRKAARNAARAGEPNNFVTFDPPLPVGAVQMQEREPILAQLRNRDGDRLLFTADRLYLENESAFVSVRYQDIKSFHWMRPDYDEWEVLNLKKTLGQQIVLEDRAGRYYELRRLGWGFQALWNFLVWLCSAKTRSA